MGEALATPVAAGGILWVFCLLPGAAYLLVVGRLGDFGRLARRLAPVCGFYVLYSACVSFSHRPSTVFVAIGNGESLERVERSLGLAWEPFLSHHTVPFANLYYGWAQVVVTLGVLTWCALNEDDSFWRLVRNSLGLIAAVGFACYLLVPMAPPRLLGASWGISGGGLGAVGRLADQMGAFPSLHTAWAGWAAIVLWAILPGRWRFVGFANLVVTGVVVLTTGNHYVLDVVAGELLAFGAGVAADRLERRRLAKMPAPQSPAAPASSAPA